MGGETVLKHRLLTPASPLDPGDRLQQTVYAVNPVAALGLKLTYGTLAREIPPRDQGSVISGFLHLSPDAPSVRLEIEGGQLLDFELSYGDSTGFFAHLLKSTEHKINVFVGDAQVFTTTVPANALESLGYAQFAIIGSADPRAPAGQALQLLALPGSSSGSSARSGSPEYSGALSFPFKPVQSPDMILALLAAGAAATAPVRVAHAVPDAPAVDVLVDGQVVVKGAIFKAFTKYLQLPAGEHKVEIRVAESTGEPANGSSTFGLGLGYGKAGDVVHKQKVWLPPVLAGDQAEPRTIAAVGALGNKSVALQVINDGGQSSVPKTEVLMRMGNLIPDMLQPITIMANENDFIANVYYGEFTNHYLRVPVDGGSIESYLFRARSPVPLGKSVTQIPSEGLGAIWADVALGAEAVSGSFTPLVVQDGTQVPDTASE